MQTNTRACMHAEILMDLDEADVLCDGLLVEDGGGLAVVVLVDVVKVQQHRLVPIPPVFQRSNVLPPLDFVRRCSCTVGKVLVSSLKLVKPEHPQT